jgi:hypothetical protein
MTLRLRFNLREPGDLMLTTIGARVVLLTFDYAAIRSRSFTRSASIELMLRYVLGF